MPKAVPARHVGRADEVESEEHVEGLDRRLLGGTGCGRRQLGLERIAGDCCPFEYETRGLRE